MSTRLGPDSAIHQALSWISALILANLVALALALPVFTAGAGLLVTALVSWRLIDSESTSILPALRSVLSGTGPAASLLLIAEGLLAVLLAWEWTVFSALSSPGARLFARALVVFVGIVLALVHVWVWPMTAQRLRLRGAVRVSDLPALVRAALLVSVAELPRSVLAIAVALGPLALAAVSLPWLIRVGFWFLVFGVAFSMYVCTLAARPVLVPDESAPDSR